MAITTGTLVIKDYPEPDEATVELVEEAIDNLPMGRSQPFYRRIRLSIKPTDLIVDEIISIDDEYGRRR